MTMLAGVTMAGVFVGVLLHMDASGSFKRSKKVVRMRSRCCQPQGIWKLGKAPASGVESRTRNFASSHV